MEPWELDVAGLVSAYREGHLRPTEVVESMLLRIAEVDREVGAFRQVLGESALAEAAESDARVAGDARPLEGIPVAIKELFDVAGTNGAYGSEVLMGRVAPVDAEAVRRLRSAGAIVVGTTRSHEFGWGITTQHANLGSTANPWDLSRVPGGSSGGSAAAVATGMVPLALGSDTGGSIRIPAAFCGVVGLKPTYGRVSKRGIVSLAPSLDHPGSIARSVNDAVAALSVLAGHDPEDPTTRLTELNPPRSRPKVALCPDLHPVPLCNDHSALFADAVDRLGAMGMEVVEVEFPLADIIRPAFGKIQMAEAYHVHSATLGTFPSRAALYGVDVRNRLEIAAEVQIADYLDARRDALAVTASFAEIFASGIDLLVTPVAAGGPSRRDRPDRVEHRGESIAFRDLVMGYTVPQDLSGLPAVTVPVGLDDDGLPVGVQLTAAWDDELTAALAAESIAIHLGWPPLTVGQVEGSNR
ncbi:MAG TPA: amidase [Acidimicrobiia bacterium]|nr:amidase [Acidimicrobiia bacterium]